MSSSIPNFHRRQALAALTALPWWCQAKRNVNAPVILLAQDAPSDPDPAGYLVSEKYDGVRAVWDGRALRFRSGLLVAAPPSFTASLPAVPLDGELWLGRGRFEALCGLVRRARPGPTAWRDLRYAVFELPGAEGSFAARALRIQSLAASAGSGAMVAVEQRRVEGRAALQRWLAQVLADGGEGLMLHRADAAYEGGRSATLLKLKPWHDADAQVVGHEAGRGKHAGRMGALRVRTGAGAEFKLGTGFSDAQRQHPPALGDWLTYTHRGHTDSGLPRFASFLRMRGL